MQKNKLFVNVRPERRHAHVNNEKPINIRRTMYTAFLLYIKFVDQLSWSDSYD